MRDAVQDLVAQSNLLRGSYATLVLVCSDELRSHLREIYRRAEEEMKRWLGDAQGRDPRGLHEVVAMYSSALGTLLPHLRREIQSPDAP